MLSCTPLKLTSAVRIFENSNSYFTIRFETDTTIRNFQILMPSPQHRFWQLEHNKLSPSLAPIVAVFSSYSHQNGDYSQSPLGDYSRRKWRQIVSLRTAKSIRFELNHYSHNTNNFLTA